MAHTAQVKQLEPARDRIDDGFGTTFQPQHALIQAPYTAKNLLYYDSSERPALALTDTERSQLVQARSFDYTLRMCVKQCNQLDIERLMRTVGAKFVEAALWWCFCQYTTCISACDQSS